MQALIGHSDLTAVKTYERIDPQSVGALAVNVTADHTSAITGAPAPTHVPWAEVTEGAMVEYRRGDGVHQNLKGRVMAKYHSQVAEILPELLAEGALTGANKFAVQHVFVKHCDIVALVDLPRPPQYEDVVLKPLQVAEAASATSPASLAHYSSEAVGKWLVSIGLPQYVERFKENGVDGALLADIENEELLELNIPLSLHRKKILSEVRKLKA